MVKQVEFLNSHLKPADFEKEVKMIEKKLEQCRNQENNPESIQ